MKTSLSIATLVGAIVTQFLVGCAALNQQTRVDEAASENFRVRFYAPVHDQGDSNRSNYSVLTKNRSQDWHAVASAYRGTNARGGGSFMKENVRLVESNDGTMLLIEEYIPNDCWMHKNYILIVAASSGVLEHYYLRVPEAPHEGTPNDPSIVLNIDRGILTFRYANGTIGSRNIQSIPQVSEPVPPG